MSLFLVASTVDADHFAIRIRSADFEDVGILPTDSVQMDKIRTPTYPAEMTWERIEGTVYLAIRIDRSGRVQDVVAQQVNLMEVGSQSSMDRWRKTFADSTVKVARKWTFRAPTTGKQASASVWTFVLPVAYMIDRTPRYATWNRYLPGPKQQVPWKTEVDVSSSTEAFAAGEVGGAGKGPHLLTSLAGG